MRQEDATYQVAGENPLSPEYKKDLETKKKIAEGKLIIKDTKVGTGAAVKDGDTVSVHYKGWLDDGKVFDESRKRGEPFTFTVGQGNVIKGWDKGLIGMKLGGKRELTIPSELGYGDNGAGSDIPPGATLHFTIELMKIN